MSYLTERGGVLRLHSCKVGDVTTTYEGMHTPSYTVYIILKHIWHTRNSNDEVHIQYTTPNMSL